MSQCTQQMLHSALRYMWNILFRTEHKLFLSAEFGRMIWKVATTTVLRHWRAVSTIEY